MSDADAATPGIQESPVRVVAIDLGDARTGIAVGDRVTGIASPAGLVEVPIGREGGAALLRGIVGQVRGLVGGDLGGGGAEVVVGLPLNMDGSEGPRAKAVRAFAARIAGALGVGVVLVDERRTTIEADARMARSGLTHKQKKMRRDAIAAAAVLRAYLDGDGVVGVVGGGGAPGDAGHSGLTRRTPRPQRVAEDEMDG